MLAIQHLWGLVFVPAGMRMMRKPPPRAGSSAAPPCLLQGRLACTTIYTFIGDVARTRELPPLSCSAAVRGRPSRASSQSPLGLGKPAATDRLCTSSNFFLLMSGMGPARGPCSDDEGLGTRHHELELEGCLCEQPAREGPAPDCKAV